MPDPDLSRTKSTDVQAGNKRTISQSGQRQFSWSLMKLPPGSPSTNRCWVMGRLGHRGHLVQRPRHREDTLFQASTHHYPGGCVTMAKSPTLSGPQILHPPDDNSEATNMSTGCCHPRPPQWEKATSRAGPASHPTPHSAQNTSSSKQRHIKGLPAVEGDACLQPSVRPVLGLQKERKRCSEILDHNNDQNSCRLSFQKPLRIFE